MKNNTIAPTHADLVATRLHRKFPSLRRCHPDGEGRIFVTYATGVTELITLAHAQSLIGQG